MNLNIGSGDISALMSGKHTKGYQDLFRKFLDDSKPYYNAFASPIDALRTGAILEFNYLNHLPDNYIFQHKATSKEMDVFTSSIDFAKIQNGSCVDFDELKTIFFTDYIDVIFPLKGNQENDYLPFLKKKFKKNYEQIQAQLFCTELDSANLVFMSVLSYDDEENRLREITEKDYTKFRINRDENIISKIKEKGEIFQTIKNHFDENNPRKAIK